MKTVWYFKKRQCIYVWLYTCYWSGHISSPQAQTDTHDLNKLTDRHALPGDVTDRQTGHLARDHHDLFLPVWSGAGTLQSVRVSGGISLHPSHLPPIFPTLTWLFALQCTWRPAGGAVLAFQTSSVTAERQLRHYSTLMNEFRDTEYISF